MVPPTKPEPPAIRIYVEGFFGLYSRGPICHGCKVTLKPEEEHGGKCAKCKLAQAKGGDDAE